MLLVFQFIALLEDYVPAKALYLRMLSLYPVLESHVFDLALSRHSREEWILELISKSRDPVRMTRTHLLGLNGELQAYWLERYVEQSIMEPVLALAKEGDDRPVYMLLDRERFDEAAVCAAYFLDAVRESGLVEGVCARYGPDIGSWALRVHAQLEKIESDVEYSYILKWYSGTKEGLDEKNKSG